MAVNYKTTGSWTAIPTAALASSYGGTYHIEYPPATDMTLSALPCGAFGKPRIVLHMPWLTDTGYAFWSGLFAAGALYVAANLEVYDDRLSAVTRYAGNLQRPKFESVSWGSTAAKTVYHNVEIVLAECVVTT